VKAGWKIRQLGDVCKVQPPKSEARQLLKPNEMVSFVPMEALGIQRKEVGATIDRALSEVQGSYTYFANGDVLLAKITPCFENGKLGIASGLTNGVGFGSSEYIVMRPSACLTADFLYYFLLQDSFREAGAKNMTGTAGQKRVTKTYVESSGIPTPPLKEQERIVAILDEAFEGIATAKANAQKSLEASGDLFNRRFMSLVSKRGPRWLDLALGEICEIERGSSPRPIKNFFTIKDDGVNWIKIGDATDGEKYIYSTKQKITPEGAKQSRFVKEGDFLLTNSMSFGKSYVMKTTGYIHDGWFVLRLRKSINQDYLYYLLSSKFVRSQFNALASGAIVLNINSDLVKRAMLPIPPFDEQQRIVEQMNVMLSETDRLKAVYQTKLNALASLKQSLLHQAFTGKL